MSTKAILTRLPIVAVGCLAFVMTAGADVWNKKTIVHFPEAVEVPGNVTLPAGTYVMKLADSSSNRHIVQFFNEREDHVYATVLAIPNYRLEPSGKTVLTFYETPKGYPMFLRAWFYPGDNFGQEFAYSKERREYIASLMNLKNQPEPVAVAQAAPPPPPVEESTAIVESATTTTATTTGDSIDDSAAASSAAEPAAEPAPEPEPEPAAAPEPEQAPAAETSLPQTATSAPALGMMALMFMGSALMLKAARRM